MANEGKPLHQPSAEDNSKPERLQKIRKILKQPLIVLGTCVAFVGVVALIYYLFVSQWTLWLLLLLVPTGMLLLFLLIQAGYAAQWTGFRRKTLWDWVDLFIKIIGALVIPISIIVLIVNVNQFNAQQKESASQALNQQHQATLDTYLDRMSDLLLTYPDRFKAYHPGDQYQEIAEARTYTAVRNLDGDSKGTLVRFLLTAGLISESKPIISMYNADLSGADFTNADLRAALQLHFIEETYP